MQTRIPIGSLAIALVLALFLTTTSTANVQNFGDFSAAKVEFNNVTESNLLMDGTTFFYGAPTVVVPADTLIPTYVDYAAEVNPGPGVAFVDSTLGMIIVAKPLESFDTIYFSEFGDYTVTGLSEVTVEVPWFVDILEVADASGNSQVITPILLKDQENASFSPPDSDPIFGIDFEIDLTAALAGITLPDGSTPTKATKVNFRFDNRLIAAAQDSNSIAFIKKKQSGGTRISTTPIPEPNSIGLGLLGLLGLVRIIRRRK